MSARREYAVALGALAVGAVLALLALQPVWLRGTAPSAAGSRVPVDLTGRELAGWAWGLGLVALAGVVGVVATRGAWRRVVGVVVAAAGIGLTVSAVAAALDPAARARAALTGTLGPDVAAGAAVGSLAPWCWLLALGGVLVAAAGLVTVLHGGRWPVMASRYERTAAAAATAGSEPGPTATPTRPSDAWAALDRGEDPTLAPEERPEPGHLPE
jgi:uncharacterized membrane protein (TIGR02234 family)